MKRALCLVALFFFVILSLMAQEQTTARRTERLNAEINNAGRLPTSWPDEEIVEFPAELYNRIIALHGRENPDLTQLGGVSSLAWLLQDPSDPDNAKLVAAGAHRWAHVTYVPSSFLAQMRSLGRRGFQFVRTAPVGIHELKQVLDDLPTLSDPLVAKQYYLDAINIKAFWTAGVSTLKSVDLFITDTNGDGSHRDLNWNPNSKNFTDKTSPLIATYYHATHVAGEMCAIRNNSLDVSGAADCTPTLYEVVQTYFTGANQNNPQTLVSDDAVLKAFLLIAKATRFTVVNCSWGGFQEQTFVADILTASEDHVLWFCAAGNNSASGTHYPARHAETHKNVIAVTATDEKGLPAWYSNQALGITKSLAAPGSANLSTEPNGTGSGQGTSYATPLVTIAGGLTAQYMSDAFGVKSEDIRPEKVRGFLLDQPIDKNLIGTDGSPVFGNPRSLNCSRVMENVDKAYKATTTPPPAIKPVITGFSASKSEIQKGENVSLNWNVSGATSIAIIPSLTTTALPASGSAVISPTATTTYTLTATNGTQSVSKSVTVTVKPTPVPKALVVHQDGSPVTADNPAAVNEVVEVYSQSGATTSATGLTGAWLNLGDGLWWQIATDKITLPEEFPGWTILPVQLTGKNDPLPTLAAGEYELTIMIGDAYAAPVKVAVQ
ncbi:MAG: S8 family serine peptidase [Candidatus Doudnabacteria bacterium]|nr:S8 family serine peptidase [Candidatus Doudnabacteria bacterium]